jgi:hypothetical protein
MVLQSGFGRGRDRLELKGEAASLVEWPAPFPRNGFEPLMQAWQVRIASPRMLLENFRR